MQLFIWSGVQMHLTQKGEMFSLCKIEWRLCPVCGSKTLDRIRKGTVLINYPLYCPKYRQEMLIRVKELNITVIRV